MPFAIEWSIPRIAASQNLRAEIGNVDLGLIVGEIALEDLVVDLPSAAEVGESATTSAPDTNSRPLLSLDRIYLAFEWTDLLLGRFHMTDLELHHPVIEVVARADGSLELPVLTSEPEAEPSAETLNPEEIPSTEEAWEFTLDRFKLIDPAMSLRHEATGEPVVHLSAEELGFDALSIGTDGIGLGGLDLEHPEVFVQREWLLGLGAESTTTEADVPRIEEPHPPATDLPPFRMMHLNIRRAGFTVQTPEGPVAVVVRIELTDVGTTPGETFPVDLGLQIDDAKLGIAGQLGLNPISFEGRVEWIDLSVPPFLRLAYPELIPWLASCNAFGDVQVVFRSVSDEGMAGLTFEGSSGISALSFKHPETGELALEWDALDIEFSESFIPLEPAPDLPTRIEMSRVSLSSPSILYTNPPVSLDELLGALNGPSESGDTATEEPANDMRNEPASALEILISEIALTNGTLRYVDRAVRPRHETKIHKLHVSVDDLDVAETIGAAKLSIEGLIQSAGTFTLEGALPAGEGELDFELRELDLVSYSSLARAAGWEIESGTTSLDSKIVADASGYKTKNKLVFHDLDVAPEDGEGFASRFGLSIDLVLAILRDPTGDISLSVPVSIDGDGAGVDIGAILVSALRRALQGAIVSPVKMLGMLVPEGAPAGSLGNVPFSPGEDALSGNADDQLDSLVELLASRPMLSLSLHGHWSENDRDPTARKILEEKATSGDDLPEITDASFFARRRVASALRASARGREADLSAEDEALLARYVVAQEVSEDRLRALARARAESLRTAILELGAPPEALSVGDASSSQEPSVSIELDSRQS
jgi:hypothetical protein